MANCVHICARMAYIIQYTYTWHSIRLKRIKENQRNHLIGFLLHNTIHWPVLIGGEERIWFGGNFFPQIYFFSPINNQMALPCVQKMDHVTRCTQMSTSDITYFTLILGLVYSCLGLLCLLTSVFVGNVNCLHKCLLELHSLNSVVQREHTWNITPPYLYLPLKSRKKAVLNRTQTIKKSTLPHTPKWTKTQKEVLFISIFHPFPFNTHHWLKDFPSFGNIVHNVLKSAVSFAPLSSVTFLLLPYIHTVWPSKKLHLDDTGGGLICYNLWEQHKCPKINHNSCVQNGTLLS